MLSTRWISRPGLSGDGAAEHEAGKAAARPRSITASWRPGASGRSWSAVRDMPASRACGSVDGATSCSDVLPFQQSSTRRSSRSHVSRETDVIQRNGLRAVSRSRFEMVMLVHSSPAVRLRVKASGGPRPPPRTWATRSVSAAGVAVDPARLANGSGPHRFQLLRELPLTSASELRRSPASSGSSSASSRRIRRDVRGLAIEIDGILGVDLDLLGDLRRNGSRAAARIRAAPVSLDTSDTTADPWRDRPLAVLVRAKARDERPRSA